MRVEQPLLFRLSPTMGVYGGWDSRALEDTICIFRARADYLIPILMPKKSERNLHWLLLGSIPVFFSLKMPSGTHSISAPGLTRQAHAQTTASDLNSHLQEHCPRNGNSCANPPSRSQPFHFLHFHYCDSVFLPLLSPTMRFGKTLLSQTMASCQDRVSDEARRNLFPLLTVIRANGASPRHSS